jgi:HD-GYP domain-containing protein (c-di-GMP phosphodiesterase class II)
LKKDYFFDQAGGLKMPRISLNEAKPGMILAEPIRRAKDGFILLQENVELKQSYIQKIQNLNLESICVQNTLEPPEDISPEPIKEVTRLKAISILRTTFNHLKGDQVIDIVKLQNLVNEILDYILNESSIVYTINKINAYDNYTYSHSVDVCVISLLIGSMMNLSRNDLEILGISALLHDIGKIFINFQVLNKPGKFNINEYEQIKAHTQAGYELLKKRVNLSFLIPHMALQHHEREDGSGYPKGLSGKRIHRFAKVIAVADTFDAMTSHRVYQTSVPSSVAIQEICDNTPLKYNEDIVDNFVKIATPYSKGSVLILSNHQTVEIIAISRLKCLIRVIAGFNEGEVYNLYQKPELKVTKWVC